MTSRDNAEYLRTLRLLAAEKHLCTQCRARPARPGRRSCQVCADRGTELRAARRKRGVCGCGKKRKRGYKQCAMCIRCKARRGDQRRSLPQPLTILQQTVLAQLVSVADDRYRFPRELFEMARGARIPGTLRALVNRGLVERLTLVVPKAKHYRPRDLYAYRATAAGIAHLPTIENIPLDFVLQWIEREPEATP